MTAKKIQCPHCECGIYVAGDTHEVVGFEPPTVEPQKEDNNQPQEGEGGHHGTKE